MTNVLKISEDQKKALRKPLDPAAISQHPTKVYLSTIKAIYVVERLNEVFGIGEWNIANEVLPSNSPKWVIVKSVFTVNGYNIKIEQFGGNDNSDPGDAYKGAATDALTKIGSYLEIGIDVFKGCKDKPASKQTYTNEGSQEEKKDDKPWISDKQVMAAVARIQAGEVQLKEKLREEFKMSKVNYAKIQAA